MQVELGIDYNRYSIYIVSDQYKNTHIQNVNGRGFRVRLRALEALRF